MSPSQPDRLREAVDVEARSTLLPAVRGCSRRLMATPLMAALLIGAAPGPLAKTTPDATLALEATSALERCLMTPGAPLPPQAAAVPAPAGLTHDDELAVALAHGSAKLFPFRGTGNDLVCGLAIYGDVDTCTEDDLVAALDKHQGWRRNTPPPNAALAAIPIRQLFWEDRLAPGLAGAMMTTRPPVEGRPTLAIAVRSTLVR